MVAVLCVCVMIVTAKEVNYPNSFNYLTWIFWWFDIHDIMDVPAAIGLPPAAVFMVMVTGQIETGEVFTLLIILYKNNFFYNFLPSLLCYSLWLCCILINFHCFRLYYTFFFCFPWIVFNPPPPPHPPQPQPNPNPPTPNPPSSLHLFYSFRNAIFYIVSLFSNMAPIGLLQRWVRVYYVGLCTQNVDLHKIYMYIYIYIYIYIYM